LICIMVDAVAQRKIGREMGGAGPQACCVDGACLPGSGRS
jgi:hypothetical protein